MQISLLPGRVHDRIQTLTQSDLVAPFLLQELHDQFDLLYIPLKLRHMPVPAWRIVQSMCKVESKRVHLFALR
jgi:hypothetical protein